MTYKPEEKIYLTYKTRMTTEARLRFTARIANAMLMWYSFSLIAFSLLDLSKQFNISNFSMISAVVSIALFAMSLFVYGERYTDRAEQFRSCYLKLQELYNSDISTPDKMKRYAEILSIYENQSDRDYDEMLFDAFLRGQKLENAAGKVQIGYLKFAQVLIKRALRVTVISAAVLLPIWFGIMWVQPIANPGQ